MRAPPAERPGSLIRVAAELRDEWAMRQPLPPGETSFSLARTHRFQRETLQMLLEYYRRHGPVFTFRSLHRRIVVMIGPEANHFVTVSGAENLSWRKGMFGEQLAPLIGDGLITTDCDYHDRAREIMMPAFHRRRMERAVEAMIDETARAMKSWRPGSTVELYEWVRDVAMSTAMRALLGLDPRAGGIGHSAATLFERALRFYDAESWMTMLRGPGTPWSKMQANRRKLVGIIDEEIARRARLGGGGEDVLSMLLEARDEQGRGFSAVELRDQLLHLLFGGHDTTSSTLSFLLYELSRSPYALARVLEEQDEVLGGRPAAAVQLLDELPYLSMALDETLRLYPPVWLGPRMSVRPFEFGGYRIPAGVHLIYSSWASHRLPEVFPNPEAFIPERFTHEARRALPSGAYIPFGGGRRICIGKRFGQLMVKAIATTILQRFTCELTAGYELRVAKLPTLSPEDGLPMVLRERQRVPRRDTVSD